TSKRRRLIANKATPRPRPPMPPTKSPQPPPHPSRPPRPPLPATPPRRHPLLLRPHRHSRQLRRHHQTGPHSRLFGSVVAKHNEREPERHAPSLSDLRRNHAPAKKRQDHQHRLSLHLRRLSRGRRLWRQQSSRRRSHPFTRS